MRPNVLLVSVDDMNDWVGCLGGHPDVSTPHIDRLGAGGVVFRNAHCPSPLCNPSRTAIFTGLRPNRSGVYHNGQWWRPAYPSRTTLPMYLKANGYTTAGAGKVYHHTDGFNPPDQWDEYFDLVFDDPWDRCAYGRVPPADPPPGHPLNGITPFEHEFDWGVLAQAEAEYGDAQVVDWACRYLQQGHTQPFFLAVGTFRPHLPCYAPQRYFDRYPLETLTLPALMDNDIEHLPPTGRDFAQAGRHAYDCVLAHEQWERAVQAYLACISFADAQIGRLFEALEGSGRAENTIVVFYSDNGFHLGEKRRWHKSTLWERATHVPLIVRVPGKADAVCDRPVNLQDIFPTLLDLCGLEAPAGQAVDGRSLVPLVDDPAAVWDPFTVTTYLRGNHAVRGARWRYIRYADGGEELYDRDADPHEERNLAGYAEFATLKRDLAQYFPADNAADVPEKAAYRFDPESYRWSPAEG